MTDEEYLILQSESGLTSEQIDLLHRVKRCSRLAVKSVLSPFEFKILEHWFAILYNAHKDIRVPGIEYLMLKSIHLKTCKLPQTVALSSDFK